MKNTKKGKKLITLACIAGVSLATLFSPMATLTAEANVPPTVSPQKHIIQWVFKIENGKFYRRLFDYTANCFVGEWEYVGEYDGN